MIERNVQNMTGRGLSSHQAGMGYPHRVHGLRNVWDKDALSKRTGKAEEWSLLMAVVLPSRLVFPSSRQP